jgi:hypothetical protein
MGVNVLTIPRFAVGRMTAGTFILVSICAASLTAGCASGGRLSRHLVQSPASGQRCGLIPGSWDRVIVLRPGSRVVVTLMDGKRLEAVFRILSPAELGLTDSTGNDFNVAKPNIRQIVARSDRDNLVNGALIGAGIGLGTAAITLGVAASGDGYVLASAKWGAPLLLSAIGGVIGVFVDRARTDDQVVYARP